MKVSPRLLFYIFFIFLVPFSPLQSTPRNLAWCPIHPKRVSTVSKFLAYDFVPRVNCPHLYPKHFWEYLKLKPIENTFANLLITDKAIITKLDQSIKLIKCYINLLNAGVKGGVAYVTWPTFKFGPPPYLHNSWRYKLQIWCVEWWRGGLSKKLQN